MILDTIEIHSGLGNQMFEYAFFLSLKHHHPWRVILLDITNSKHVHQGYELPRIFGIKHNLRLKTYYAINYFRNVHSISYEFHEKSPFLYDISAYNQKKGTYYSGCWQSEQYFKGIESKVRDAFVFKESLLNSRTIELSRFLMSVAGSVSIHIRRGDYLEENRYTCTLDYYNNAINYIKNKIDNPHFVIFSDDMDWVKEKLIISNAIYVDWNTAKDSWQDMFLMSRCKHNIIANSTFSWWGAWLNNNPQKIVIVPPIWLDQPTKSIDIIPHDWIILENES